MILQLRRHFIYISVRGLDKARSTGQFAQSGSVNSKTSGLSFDGGSESESSGEGELSQGRRKKLKTE